MTSPPEPLFGSARPRGAVRRRIFWSMLAIATVALLIAGLVAALVGQSIVGRQTRTEMVRQAAAIEALLGERLSEDSEVARFLISVLEGERDAPTAFDGSAPRTRALFQLVGSARRLFGSPLVDLAFFDASGQVVFLTDATAPGLSNRLSTDDVFAGRGQYVQIDGEGDDGVAFLVHVRPVPIVGLEDAPVRMAIVVARQRAFIDVAQVVRGMLLALGVATALSALVSRLLARRLTRRLDGLADAAAALADGDVSARAPVDGHDEVADVARSFNVMAEELENLADRERAFLMSVGHDLRTPLTTIAGYAEMLEDRSLDDAETGRIAGVLAGETARLRRLVEDLMLLARLEAREFTLEMEDVDVSAHVTELMAAFQPRAAAARVHLDLVVEPTGVSRTDPDRVGQILSNLVENALRYSPEAGTVGVRVRRVESEIELAVTDAGSGIDAEDIPHVFEKFYVARRYRRVRPEGSGLGLSIVKQLVDALGGRVAVTSEPGGGTAVWVRLPGAGQARSSARTPATSL